MKDNYMIKTQVIRFEDGTFFSGVKGKMVRSTRSFIDAKKMSSISSRDKDYLSDYRKNYEVLNVEFSMKVGGVVDNENNYDRE